MTRYREEAPEPGEKKTRSFTARRIEFDDIKPGMVIRVQGITTYHESVFIIAKVIHFLDKRAIYGMRNQNEEHWCYQSTHVNEYTFWLDTEDK